MINIFLKLYNPINAVMIISNNKAFKNKKLLILEEEIKFLINTLKIIKVFVKAINKMQGEVYPIIYYTIPLVYNIYNSLDKLKEELKANLINY